MNRLTNQRGAGCLLLAMLPALLSLEWPTAGLFVVTATLSLLGGLLAGSTLLRDPDSRFSFFQTAAVAIVLASSAGSLFTFGALSWQSDDLWETVVAYAHTTPTDLALAQGYTNAFALALLLVGGWLERRGRLEQLSRSVDTALRDYRRALHGLMGALGVSQAYLLHLGVVVYGGKDLLHETDPTHPLLALIGPVVPVLPVVLAAYAREQYAHRRYWRAGLYGLMLAAELGWFFLHGRRSIFFFFLLAAFGLLLNRPVRPRWLLRHSLPIALTALLAVGLADTYHKMRVLYRFEGAQQMRMTDALAGLGQADDDQYSRIRNRNVALRSSYSSFALGQFVNLFRTAGRTPLGGRELAGSLLVATPSSLVVDKRDVLVKERLYESAFAIPLTDISETLYLESFIDFGPVGFILYVGFISLLFLPLYRAAASGRNPLFAVLFAGISASMALGMVEMDLVTFLLGIRTLVVCYVLAWLLRKESVQPPAARPEPV